MGSKKSKTLLHILGLLFHLQIRSLIILSIDIALQVLLKPTRIAYYKKFIFNSTWPSKTKSFQGQLTSKAVKTEMLTFVKYVLNTDLMT